MIEISDLRIEYELDDRTIHAVNGVDLSIGENEIIGLVGESGCGKTTLAKSLIRLLARNGDIVEGSIDLNGTEITTLTDKQLRQQIRWSEISMIPQNAMNAFDPVYTVGNQIVEVILEHTDTKKSEAWDRARQLFEDVGIEPNRVKDYPHQFSGGMAQRAIIALALALNPSVIIADEPTTALDVINQEKVLSILIDLTEDMDTSILLITHDMSVVAQTCDKIAVMYGGRVVEFADTRTIIENPVHPYTLGLKNAFPELQRDQELISIPGEPPMLTEETVGCNFAPRCPFAEERCEMETPMLEQHREEHWIECHRRDEEEYLQQEAVNSEVWAE